MKDIVYGCDGCCECVRVMIMCVREMKYGVCVCKMKYGVCERDEVWCVCAR